MSDTINQAITALNAKLADSGYDGSAKFVIEDEGTIMMDGNGAREGDEDADVTMKANADTFRAILDGDLNPTTAFMTGRLKIEGDMGAAMRLAPALS